MDGSSPERNAHSFQGYSHIAIYNRALTPAEVIKVYNETK